MQLAGGDDPETRGSKLRAFLIILAIHTVAEFWRIALDARDAALDANQPVPWWFWPGILVPGIATALAIVPRTRRWGFALWTAVAVALHVYFFPHAGNHLLLMLLFLAMGAFFDWRDEREQELMLQSVKWLIAIVFFYSGIQKLLHGYYFRGELFAYYISIRDNYEYFFQFITPASEIARMKAFTGAVGEGPYTLDAPLALLASNATYILEIVLPIFLLIPRTRFAATILTAVSFVLIQIAARELFFFGLYMNGLFLFFRRDVNRYAIPVFILYYVWLLLMQLHLIPEIWFG